MADSTTIQLRFDAMRYESVDVVPLPARQFRLEHTPLLSSEPVYTGDVIEAEHLPDGIHQFLRVVERAPMRHYAWVVPRGWHDSPDRAAYVAKVENAGGRWEQVFGGVLRVHIPSESAFDPEAELDRHLRSDWPEA
jgi:hypothetical protein